MHSDHTYSSIPIQQKVKKKKWKRKPAKVFVYKPRRIKKKKDFGTTTYDSGLMTPSDTRDLVPQRSIDYHTNEDPLSPVSEDKFATEETTGPDLFSMIEIVNDELPSMQMSVGDCESHIGVDSEIKVEPSYEITFEDSPTEVAKDFPFPKYEMADIVVKKESTLSQFEGPYKRLKEELANTLTAPYCLHRHTNPDVINIVAFYPSIEKTAVKLNITVDRNYTAKLYVHRKEIPYTHSIWVGLPDSFCTALSIDSLIQRLNSVYFVCYGNYDEQYHDLVTNVVTASQQSLVDSACNTGYMEDTFGHYRSTIRSTHCHMLIEFGERCGSCSNFRTILRKRKHRLDTKIKNRGKTVTPNFLHKQFKHCNMLREELIEKIDQQNTLINTLRQEVDQTKRLLQKQSVDKDLKLKDTISAYREHIQKVFLDENEDQQLFWNEQVKCANVKSASAIRWHPKVMQMCIDVSQKSKAAYEVLRNSGFVALPCPKTLFEYSRKTNSSLDQTLKMAPVQN